MADQTEQSPATTPAAPQSNLEALTAAFAEAAQGEKTDNTPGEKAADLPSTSPEPVKAEAPPAEAPPAPTEKTWEKLMQEKAALRHQQEALKANPNVALQSKLDPGSVQALLKAKESGDPLGVLAALGFSYGDVTKQLLSTPETQPSKAPEPPPPAHTLPPEIQRRLDQAEAYIVQQQRREILNNVKEVLPADKFKLITGRGEYETVLGYLERFHAETGTLPGATFNESVQIAAEALESRLAQEAEKWRKVLTPAQPPANVQGEAQRSPPQSGQVTSPVHTTKTLTNSAVAPAAVKPELTTRDEILADLLKDPEFNR